MWCDVVAWSGGVGGVGAWYWGRYEGWGKGGWGGGGRWGFIASLPVAHGSALASPPRTFLWVRGDCLLYCVRHMCSSFWTAGGHPKRRPVRCVVRTCPSTLRSGSRCGATSPRIPRGFLWCCAQRLVSQRLSLTYEPVRAALEKESQHLQIKQAHLENVKASHPAALHGTPTTAKTCHAHPNVCALRVWCGHCARTVLLSLAHRRKPTSS